MSTLSRRMTRGLFVLLSLLCSAHLWAYDFLAKNDDGVYIYYNISGSEATVTYHMYGGRSQYSGKVTIPETVTHDGNTYTVTSIGEQTFYNCSQLWEITIPNSVTSIGEQAFYDCSQLEVITIPESVTEIGSLAFFNCKKLMEITLPESLTSIGNYAFQNCSYLSQVNFDATACTTAGSSSAPVFSGCTSLITINIGERVTIIPSCLFYSCTWVTQLTIPNSVTLIGGSAFYSCTGVTELTIGNSVAEIGSSAFYGCTELTQVTIPKSVTSIGTSAFSGCVGLTEITIPNMVAEIGGSAFSGCTSLTEVNYNATACTSAGSSSSHVFGGCGNVVNLMIGENVTTIPAYAFYGCTNLTEINSLSTAPPTISGTTFENVVNVEVPKEALNKYALADNWTDIPRIYAQNNENVYYPVPISYKGAVCITAVGGDENGTEALAGGTVQFSTIESNNLAYGLATHVAKDITEELVNTGNYSLTVSEYHKENTICCYSPEADNLYDITVQEAGQVLNEITVSKINSVYSLKVTGDINGTDITTIRRMTNLTTLDLSDANVVSGGSEYYDTYTTSDSQIGSYFFYDMASLKTVVLPSNITSIGSYAFGNCTDLTVITIPESVTSVANDAFSGCTSLAIVTLEDGVNTMSLSTSAFNKCPIATLHVGRKLNYSSTSSLPFANLSTLTTLTIGDEVESVINSEYYGCSGLASLTIGDWVTSVGSSAFYGCASLTEATIGSRVETIGGNAFSGGVSLAVINSKNPTPPDIESNTFNNVNKETCVLNIPTGSLNDYWLDRYWGEFLNINDDLPNAIRNIVNSSGNAEAVGHYTLDGKQVSTPQRGVNIIRYSDGTARKVLVK